jgi:hypothetical protein
MYTIVVSLPNNSPRSLELLDFERICKENSGTTKAREGELVCEFKNPKNLADFVLALAERGFNYFTARR